MLPRLHYYHYLFIRKLLLLKFNYIHSSQLPKITSLKCYIPLKALDHAEDMSLFDAVAILEFITGRRVYLRKLKAIRVGTVFIYETGLHVTLRNEALLIFLYSFQVVLSYKFNTRENYITLDLIDKRQVILSFRDTELFNFDFWFYKPFTSNIFVMFLFDRDQHFREAKTFLGFWGIYV